MPDRHYGVFADTSHKRVDVTLPRDRAPRHTIYFCVFHGQAYQLLPVRGASRLSPRITTVRIDCSLRGWGLKSGALCCCCVRVVLSCMLFHLLVLRFPSKKRRIAPPKRGVILAFRCWVYSFLLYITPANIIKPIPTSVNVASSGTGHAGSVSLGSSPHVHCPSAG